MINDFAIVQQRHCLLMRQTAGLSAPGLRHRGAAPGCVQGGSTLPAYWAGMVDSATGITPPGRALLRMAWRSASMALRR